MRVTVISDVHGAVDRLRAVAGECDALVVLGDLINVLDYRSMEGILVEVFGREPVAAAAEHRARGDFHRARETLRSHGGPEEEARARFVALARRQYEVVLDAMPAGTVLTFGNVDIPGVLRELLPSHVRLVDGETFELAGLRWGIVGGGMPSPLGIPGEVPEDVFDAKLGSLGEVDIVGTHIPPRIPWFCYDTVAAKFEPGSAGLVGHIVERQPRYCLFGHVHQPLASRGHIGRTELVNVGHFQAHGRGWTYESA